MQLTNITNQPLPIYHYLPFLDGALFLPPPEGFPVLLGQPAEPLPLPPARLLPLPPRLPPERLPLDFAIFFHLLLHVDILSVCRYRVRSDEKDSKKIPHDCYFLLEAIILLPCSVQLSSTRSHCTRLINWHIKRDEMCLSQPPKRLEQWTTWRCTFV